MNAVYRQGLEPVPDRMRKLPVDHRGYCVPYFVAWIDGKPDFRVVDPEKFHACIVHKRCWLCGDLLGRYMTFVIGPMCGINHTLSEPPSHHECAAFAVRTCPFMLLPLAKRRDANLPEKYEAPAGLHLERNPGAMALWTTKAYKPFRVDNGTLIDIGEPEHVQWFCRGLPATREQVQESIDSGFHHLWRLARQEGIDAAVTLENYVARLDPWLPR